MIFNGICFLFDAIILSMYFRNILGQRKKSVHVFLYILSFAVCEAVLFVLSACYNNLHDSSRMYVTISVSFLTTFLLSFLHDSRLKPRLFVSVTFQAYATISEVIVFLLFSCFPEDVFENLMSDDTYGTACSKIVLFIMISGTLLFWRRKEIHATLQYSLLVLIMPILSIMLMTIIPFQNVTGTGPAVVKVISMTGVLFANVANYVLLKNVLKVNELQQIERQQKKQLEYQTAKYQQISTVYRNSRKLIHDMKKHFFFISHCVENKEYDAVTPYIHTAIQDIEQSHNKVNTGNLVIDAFVSNHMTIAEQEHIEFLCDIQIAANQIEIRDYDLSVILGNLLDNALYACRKVETPLPRHISVQIFTTSLELVLHIANSVSPTYREITEEKEDLYHGFGTKNVESIVGHYMGTYTHYMEQEKYHCIVAIPYNIK